MAHGLAVGMLCLSIWIAGAVAPKTAVADPVVVELFTSQGCSACPPADALMARLAARDDVIALALHVDYWDYIGWKDVFATPAFSDRQRAYAHAAKRHMVYTPQIIVDGRTDIAGARPEKVADAIRVAAAMPARAELAVRREGAQVQVTLQAVAQIDGPARVILVTFRSPGAVEVTRGENAGHTITHVNVVTDWQEIARWNGTTPLRIAADLAGPDEAAVLVQAEGPGPMLAAAMVP